MRTGVTVISGIHPLFERPLRQHAEEVFQTNDVKLILKPGIDLALGKPECFQIEEPRLFSLKEEMQTLAERTLGSRPRNCMIITDTHEYREDEPEYGWYEEVAIGEYKTVKSWKLFGRSIMPVCCVRPLFEFYDVVIPLDELNEGRP